MPDVGFALWYDPRHMTEIIETMVRAALEGGREVMGVYAGEIAVELKDDRSPLTEADRRSHDTIVRILSDEAEDIALLSEEGAHAAHTTRADWDRYFLIDPLDGTKEFIKRNGEFTVNIALIERSPVAPAGSTDSPGPTVPSWMPVAGVVYAPDLGELFVGTPSGAWRWHNFRPAEVPTGFRGAALGTGGTPIPIAATTRPYTVIASRSHMSAETEAFVQRRRTEYPDLQLKSAGSSLKLCRVADGTADEYPRFAPTMEWDTAAGDAVARAAGCKVLRWDASKSAPAGSLVYNKKDLHNPWFLVTRSTAS